MAKKNAPAVVSKRKLTRRSPEQQRNPLYIWLIVGGVGLALLVGGLFYLGYQGQAIANSGIEELAILSDLGRGHQEGDLQYTDLIPASGPHNSAWLNCGIYAEPVRRENVIHSMEHGAVWLAYQPDLPAEQVEYLRNLVKQERSKQGESLIVLAPQPGLDAPLVATAWRVQLKLDNVSDERLQLFLDRYQRGPFYPEPGASCTFGGIGEPVSS
jgi:hypothetical protein